jgi:hypothetical protein
LRNKERKREWEEQKEIHQERERKKYILKETYNNERDREREE